MVCLQTVRLGFLDHRTYGADLARLSTLHLPQLSFNLTIRSLYPHSLGYRVTTPTHTIQTKDCLTLTARVMLQALGTALIRRHMRGWVLESIRNCLEVTDSLSLSMMDSTQTILFALDCARLAIGLRC